MCLSSGFVFRALALAVASFSHYAAAAAVTLNGRAQSSKWLRESDSRDNRTSGIWIPFKSKDSNLPKVLCVKLETPGESDVDDISGNYWLVQPNTELQWEPDMRDGARFWKRDPTRHIYRLKDRWRIRNCEETDKDAERHRALHFY